MYIHERERDREGGREREREREGGGEGREGVRKSDCKRIEVYEKGGESNLRTNYSLSIFFMSALSACERPLAGCKIERFFISGILSISMFCPFLDIKFWTSWD